MEIRSEDLIIRGLEFETDAVFTTESHGAFNASAVRRYAEKHGRRVLSQQYVPHVLKCMLNCDLDMEHCMRLGQLGDRELFAKTILLYVDLGETQMCIDGNHRLAEICRRSMQRGEYIVEVRALIVSLEEAKRFAVTYSIVGDDGIEREMSSAEMLAKIQGVYSDHGGEIRDTRRYGT